MLAKADVRPARRRGLAEDARAFAGSAALSNHACVAALSASQKNARAEVVAKAFPKTAPPALADEFMGRAAAAFAARGLSRDTTIALTAMCRDEACAGMRELVEEHYGQSFHAHSLGGAITLGKVGMGAFMHHSPTEGGPGGRERYAFISMAHCAVDSSGKVGAMQREGRHECSSGCGALLGALGHVKGGGGDAGTPAWRKQDSLELDRLNPEFKFLCRRVDSAMAQPGAPNPKKIGLADMTILAAGTAREDLEELIADCVDTKAADYCVITGIHVHNWGPVFNTGEGDVPNLEYVIPTSCYSVVNGHRVDHNDVAFTGDAGVEGKLQALENRMMALERLIKSKL
jgi:hypothetical protein